jgi:hypothetical protein
LWPPAVLVLGQKTVFEFELGVAVTSQDHAVAAGLVECNRKGCVQLKLRGRAIIGIDAGEDACRIPGNMRRRRELVDLPMSDFDGLGIVGAERRARTSP